MERKSECLSWSRVAELFIIPAFTTNPGTTAGHRTHADAHRFIQRAQMSRPRGQVGIHSHLHILQHWPASQESFQPHQLVKSPTRGCPTNHAVMGAPCEVLRAHHGWWGDSGPVAASISRLPNTPNASCEVFCAARLRGTPDVDLNTT